MIPVSEDCAMRLAAISTAALGNTEESRAQRIDRDHPYWTAAYGDVCRAVDREMALRKEVDELRKKLGRTNPSLDEALNSGDGSYRP